MFKNVPQPPASKQSSPQRHVKTNLPNDTSLFEKDLSKVIGGPIYMDRNT